MSQIEKFNLIYKTLLKIKLSHIQIKNILFLYSLNKNLSLKKEILKRSNIFFRSKNKIIFLKDILNAIENDLDIRFFIFILKIISLKALLLKELRIKRILMLEENKRFNINKIDIFKKDNIFLSNDTMDFLKELSKEAISLKKYSMELNQIFRLIFGESTNKLNNW